ncbi:RimK family protein [Desulfobotulus mexicanus]|uniref:RimK family protein n=1 Tax=Desulfobotulus mexicanus TaxID=2586642 RepID=A0A5S5MDS8_9BACT|nr:RimK family protein [Desulfobotulus mexicanus]TYT73861.1 RimK family protein [Desulfobotulus mexicanus]
MNDIIVVDMPSRWPVSISGAEVVGSREYLMDGRFLTMKRARVFNLCRSYRYQSTGYYVSLLAAARGHKAFPTIASVQDIKSMPVVRLVTEDLDRMIQKSLASLQREEFELSIYFGRNLNPLYDRLAMEIFNLFQCPLLRVNFMKKDGRWQIRTMRMIGVSEIPDIHFKDLVDFAEAYLAGRGLKTRRPEKKGYDLAILTDPAEKMPPSNPATLKRFIRAGQRVGLNVSLITRNDYHRIGFFDALFIRETTAVNHHTFRFAQRAEAEGLVVMDDPLSIIKCTNKVYLAELLTHHGIATPETSILSRQTLRDAALSGSWPRILKQPDSAFSQGVIKVDDKESFIREAERFLEGSDLIISQAFTPTEYDWRIGVLAGEPLFACKYFMARSHWQIVNWKKTGNSRMGDASTLALEAVPDIVLKTALKAARLVGNGLYGIDLKLIGKKAYVIEVNDNPNIDAGIEDAVLKEALYDRIMGYFYDAVVRKKGVR